jgi:hypothetical protein
VTIVPSTSTEVIERLRMIQALCLEIANRLEDEASAQTIPRNFEYEGRRSALLTIADEISKTIDTLEQDSSSDKVRDSIQTLYTQVEARKQQNQEEQERNVDYQHNFRMSGLYFIPRGAVTGCEKALEWLRESLKSVGIPSNP